MPRRRAVTREQLEVLLALPATETELIRHWTLGAADLAAIERRRGDPNQLGFALQLCAFRYPGRLLRPREAIPELALGFVAGQLGVAHDALATYAVRVQTRREQLGLVVTDVPKVPIWKAVDFNVLRRGMCGNSLISGKSQLFQLNTRSSATRSEE